MSYDKFDGVFKIPEFMKNTESEVRVDAGVMRTCYDCDDSKRYLDGDIYTYYDAEQGNVTAFTCKSCGLTNQVNA